MPVLTTDDWFNWHAQMFDIPLTPDKNTEKTTLGNLLKLKFKKDGADLVTGDSKIQFSLYHNEYPELTIFFYPLKDEGKQFEFEDNITYRTYKPNTLFTMSDMLMYLAEIYIENRK